MVELILLVREALQIRVWWRSDTHLIHKTLWQQATPRSQKLKLLQNEEGFRTS